MTSEQVRAARALLRWEQKDLAEASGISLPTIKRLETIPGQLAAQSRTADAIRSSLESAGVQFIDENGGGVGVRLREKSPSAQADETPLDDDIDDDDAVYYDN